MRVPPLSFHNDVWSTFLEAGALLFFGVLFLFALVVVVLLAYLYRRFSGSADGLQGQGR